MAMNESDNMMAEQYGIKKMQWYSHFDIRLLLKDELILAPLTLWRNQREQVKMLNIHIMHDKVIL